MREWAALTRARIESLRKARRKAREATSYARPPFAEAMGWDSPDYGDESGGAPESREAA